MILVELTHFTDRVDDYARMRRELGVAIAISKRLWRQASPDYHETGHLLLLRYS
ncbi:MAG: hypothetical protein GY801_44650 [bacterium]|nr:hypothetical protein [bacterium]